MKRIFEAITVIVVVTFAFIILTSCGETTNVLNDTATQNNSLSAQDPTTPTDPSNPLITDPFGDDGIVLEADAQQINVVLLQTVTNNATQPLLDATQLAQYKQALRGYMARLTWGRINLVFQELPTANLSAVLTSCPGSGLNFPTVENYVLQNFPQISTADVSLVLGHWSCGVANGSAGRQPHRYMVFSDSMALLNTINLDLPTLPGFVSIFRGLISALGSSVFGAEREGIVLNNNYPHTGSYGNPATDYETWNGLWSVMGDVYHQKTSLTSAFLSPWNYNNMGWNVLKPTDMTTYLTGTTQVDLARYNTRNPNGFRILNIGQLIDNPDFAWFPDYFEVMVTVRYSTTDQHHHLVGELGKNPFIGAAAIQVFDYDLTTATLPLQIDFSASTFTHRLSLTVSGFDPVTEVAHLQIVPLP